MNHTNDRLTIGEAAALLGVHANTIRHRIKRGIYPTERVLTPHGEAYVIPRAVVEAEQQASLQTPTMALVAPEDAAERAAALHAALQEAMQETVQPLVRELGATREELGRARERVTQLEAALKAREEPRRGWLRRLFGL